MYLTMMLGGFNSGNSSCYTHHTCSCITVKDIDGVGISPINTPTPWNSHPVMQGSCYGSCGSHKTHIKGGPGYLEDSARDPGIKHHHPHHHHTALGIPSRAHVSSINGCSNKPLAMIKKTTTRAESGTGGTGRFSHLMSSSEYMRRYRNSYSSTVLEKGGGSNSTQNLWVPQQQQNKPSSSSEADSNSTCPHKPQCSLCSKPSNHTNMLRQLLQGSRRNIGLRSAPSNSKKQSTTSVPLHEINLVVPRSISSSINRPTPHRLMTQPDLWYTSSTVDSSLGFQVKGNSCTSARVATTDSNKDAVVRQQRRLQHYIHSSTAAEDVTTNYATIVKNKVNSKSIVHIDFSEHLNSLHEYPIYGAVPSVDNETVNNDVLKPRPLKRRHKGLSEENYYTPLHKVDSVKAMEQGFKELLVGPSTDQSTKGQQGRLLAGKIRSKTDAGHQQSMDPTSGFAVEQGNSMSNALSAKKMKTPVKAADQASNGSSETSLITDNNTITNTKSQSYPTLLKTTMRRPPTPCTQYCNNQESLMIVGNPDLYKHPQPYNKYTSNQDSRSTSKRPISTKVKYRLTLDPSLLRNPQDRWKRERRSSCFRRSSRRRSRKWVFLNDIGELQQANVNDPVSLLDDIVNTE